MRKIKLSKLIVDGWKIRHHNGNILVLQKGERIRYYNMEKGCVMCPK